MKANPCFKCLSRYIGCHGSCKAYTDWCKAREKEYKETHVMSDYVHDGLTKHLKRRKELLYR